MGVEYSARIVVGLPYDEVEDYIKSVSDEEGYYDDSLLYRVSPWYDADTDECLFGILVVTCNDFSYTSIGEVEFPILVAQAHERFKDITGKDGRLYLSTYGS